MNAVHVPPFPAHVTRCKFAESSCTLIVVLPSKWTGGELTVQCDSLSRTFTCDPALQYGGSFQHISFWRDAKLSGTRVTSGYFTAIVYQLSFVSYSPTGQMVRLLLPPKGHALGALQQLVRAMGVQFALAARGGVAAEVINGLRRRVLMKLDHRFGLGSLSVDDMKGGDRELCSLLRTATRHCHDVGAYLAILETDAKCSQRIGDDESSWTIDSINRTLLKWVDLRSGESLVARTELINEVNGFVDGFSVIPRDGLILDYKKHEVKEFVRFEKPFYEYDNSNRARKTWQTAVLVVDFDFDAWTDLIFAQGFDATIVRLCAEMDASGTAAGEEALLQGRQNPFGTTTSPALLQLRRAPMPSSQHH